ncbi:MAG: T9SS type A sorting domain-containing protein [Ignavibacteriae bacterium]|nr:T9SS type A sorting domain-containing protein [Ignavibacteriota bacterium]MCB9244703.1 T9SS type A sorting domain-containing protein [Ignavibacteriales bacterium]
MKIRSLLIIASVLFAVNSFAGDIYHKVGDRGSDDTRITVQSSDVNKTMINIEVNGYFNSAVNEGDATYDKIYLKEYTSLGETGQPSLPVIVKWVAIPNNKDVKVNIMNASSQEVDNVNIYPSQEFPMRNGNGKTQFVKDNNYYSRNVLAPSQIVKVREIAAFRDYRVAIIEIHPMQYNPAQRKLVVYNNIDFELRYEGVNTENNVHRSNPSESKSFLNMYKDLILNYEYVSDNNSGILEAPNMLIITADNLYTGILPFAEWKTQKGIRTNIVKMSDIGTGDATPNQDQVKAYLTSAYNGPDRPEFVLLVGDAAGQNTIPWFSVGFDKSDHPYSCLEGNDIIPDVSLGRISVQSLPELEKAVLKLIQYEKYPNMSQTDWYKRAFVLHSNDGIDPINGQVAKNVFLNEGGFTNVDIANPSTSQSQITAYLNGGVSWVWYIGHGYEEAWATPYWHMNNMPNLTYGTRLPSIVSIACSNADLDWNATNDCFGEAFIERDTINSASNICAATELCAFYTTDTLGRYMLYAYFREGINDFGSMMNYGKINAYNYFNGNNTVQETIHEYLVLGDPTQEAYSDVPKTLTVTTSQSSSPNSIITVNVKSNGNNIEGAMVGINQNNDLRVAGYTNVQGNFEFSSSTLVNGFPVSAVVTGKNLAPYIGDIITNVNFVSEIPESYRLGQNYPNPFNPSTKIDFALPHNGFVTLKVYDVLGKEVATLVNGQLNAGTYNVDFNAGALSSGIYFYRLSTDGFTEIKKMTLLK